MMGQIRYPERDADKRRVLSLMLGLSQSASNKLTVEELEGIAVKRGYIKK